MNICSLGISTSSSSLFLPTLSIYTFNIVSCSLSLSVLELYHQLLTISSVSESARQQQRQNLFPPPFTCTHTHTKVSVWNIWNNFSPHMYTPPSLPPSIHVDIFVPKKQHKRVDMNNNMKRKSWQIKKRNFFLSSWMTTYFSHTLCKRWVSYTLVHACENGPPIDAQKILPKERERV